MTTHYNSSKGPMPIAEMPLRYAANALNKLRRDEPSRTEEIDALAAHVATLETIVENVARHDAESAPIGHNSPPPDEAPSLTGWEAVKANLDDLLVEAANWADGVAIVNQAQADVVARLKQDLQAGANAADAARVEEKRPLDEQIDAIQSRYNAYIAPLKNKVPGKVSKAVAALNNALTAWLRKLDDEKRERERIAAAEAAKAAQEALAARAEAKQSTDLVAMDQADDLLAQAETLLKQAKGVHAEKVQAGAGEGYRAQSLRSHWVAELVEGQGVETLRWYLKVKPDRVRAFLQSLADEDVRMGIRSIPGVHIYDDKRI